jgi:beta-glucosidase
MPRLIFPKGFIWGASTSAYQIEGGYKDDGKGESIWDRFTHTSGKIFNNDTGDVACDHYHLYENDVKLLKELGLKSYSFSISWPRIFPDGIGKPNQMGIDFYRNLANLLIDNGITPAVTLYHWDLPQKLQDMGGWAIREMAEYFDYYARYVFQELRDVVRIWKTFNEPWVTSFIGYWYGGHPPGIANHSIALAAAHNIMLAHGMAVRSFREMGMKGEIGIVLNLNPIYPASEDDKDLAAARRYGDFYNGWFLDPILKGQYPEELVKWLSGKVEIPKIENGDLELIRTPIDFLGINSYTFNCVAHDLEKEPLQVAFMNTGKAKTDSGWEIFPEGMYDLLMYLHREYNGIKMMVTENGAAFKDTVDNDGKVEDDSRISYLNDHIFQVYRAIRAGVNIAGYYVWSLMDNFEWNAGYSKRFGLIYVDYQTQKRTVKKSGRWYKQIIQNNGIIM